MSNSLAGHKRSLLDYGDEEVDESEPVESQAKRVAPQPLSTTDLLDETMLEGFQKDALWREMQLYKQKLQSEVKRREVLSASLDNLDSSVAILGRYWAVLVERLRMAIPSSPTSDAADPLASVLATRPIDQAELERCFNNVKGLLDSIVTKLKPECPADVDSSAYSDLVDRHSQLIDRLAKLQSDFDSSRRRESELAVHVETANDSLEMAQRKILRQQSSIVRRFAEVGSTTASTVDLNAVSTSGVPVAAESVESVANAPPASEDFKRLLEERDMLKEDCEIWSEKNSRLNAELMEVEKRHHELAVLLDRANADLRLLPEHVIVETGTFKHIEAMLGHAREDLFVYKQQNEDLRQQLELLNVERSAISTELLGDFSAKQTTLESEIKKLSADLNRMRAQRDSLQLKCESLNASFSAPKQEVLKLKENFQSAQSYIEFLLQCIERMKAKMAACANDESLYRNVLLASDLELSRDVADDEAVVKYTALVSSLQKELDIAKVKVMAFDQIEAGNEKSLSLSNADLIKKCKSLEKKLQYLHQASGDVVDLGKIALSIDGHKQAEMMAMREMETIADIYTKSEKRHREEMQQLITKDEDNSKLTQDKIRLEHKLSAAMKEKDNCNNKLIAAQKSLAKKQELVKQLEETEGIRNEHIKNIEREIAHSKTLILVHEDKTREILQLTEQLNAKLEKNSNKYLEMTELLKSKETVILELQKIRRSLEDDNKKYQSKIKNLNRRLQLTTGRDDNQGIGKGDEDLELLQGYKKIAQCSVCEFRIKNHVITKCMHVFCKECIDDRLETRQRKCPQCGAMFGPGDVKMIYI
eukprot:Partr_v1_DN28144_c0_g1_i7_m55680 putative E3 ubiquitin- protein ligase